MVDPALAAEFRFDRLHGHAVRGDAAIAAAFADKLVDDDAPVGIGKEAALAAAAFFRGAGLVVDQDGRAGRICELALNLIEIVAPGSIWDAIRQTVDFQSVVADFNWIFTDTLEETLDKLKAWIRGAAPDNVDA